MPPLAIRNAKPGAKPVKLYDEKGLFLLINTKGGKWWRFKYRFEGKEKLISLGVYPDTGLKEARDNRDEARKLVAKGIDPGEQRKTNKHLRAEANANSFEVVAREWFSQQTPNWALSHSTKIIKRLERDIFPTLGNKPIAEITAPDLLRVLRRIEQRGVLETTHRAKQNCGQIFRYAIVTGTGCTRPIGRPARRTCPLEAQALRHLDQLKRRWCAPARNRWL